MEPTFGDRRPEIEYPCSWTFLAIGEDEAALRTRIATVVGDVQHSLELSKRSAGGKYTSLSLELVVQDEAHRTRIFEALQGAPEVKFVF